MPKNIYVSIDYSRAVPLRYTVYCAEQTDADYANGRKGLRADELSELAVHETEDGLVRVRREIVILLALGGLVSLCDIGHGGAREALRDGGVREGSILRGGCGRVVLADRDRRRHGSARKWKKRKRGFYVRASRRMGARMGHGDGKGEVRRETDQPVGEDYEFLALVDGRVWEGAFWCRFCRRHEDILAMEMRSLV